MRQFPPVGKCIYCGTTEPPLKKEHSIPYGLGGDWVLLEASCGECEKITSRFERRILRGPLLAVRTATKMPTRHKHERPTELPITIERSGNLETFMVPVENHLTLVHLPLFPAPACLEERPYEAGIEVIGTETVHFGRALEELVSIHGATTFSHSENSPFLDFARMVEKIAYCEAVATVGLDAIEEAFVLPAILGQRDDIGRWVGSDDYVFELEEHENLRHAVKASLRRVVAIQTGEVHDLILINVKLFAGAHPTGYLVVVGRLKQ